MPNSVIKIPKIASYAKNVGKSVAFMSINAVKENMPGLQGFMSDNNDVFVDIYSGIKDYKNTLRRTEKSIKDSNLFKAIDYGMKNIIEDAKTGNFYNDRSKDIADVALGIDDESIDMDFNFSDDSKSSNNSARYVSDNFNSIMRESTVGMTTAVAKGTDMVVKSTRASTTVLSSQIERSTATLHSGLGAVYNSIGAVNAFLNGPMMAHLNNSKLYYENSLKIMQEQHAMMKEMLEMQRSLYSPKTKNTKLSALDESMSANGMVNLRGYMKTIKSNIQNIMDNYGFGMMAGSGINVPMMIAAAPFKIALDIMAADSKFIPKNIKKNLSKLDSSFTGLFGQFVGKMNRNKNDMTKNPFMRILGEIFGISTENKRSINTSNYNKGAVPFDGITRKTIIEVIPGYLARIEAALTGKGERHFDPNSGRWKTAKQIEIDFNAERINSIEGANRGITRDLNGRFDDKTYKRLEPSIRRMKEKIYEDGFFDPSIFYTSSADSNGRRIRKASGDAYKRYGFKNKKDFEAVLSMLRDDTFYGLASANMRAKQAYSRKLQEFEEFGGIYNNLFNGAYSNDGKPGRADPSKFTGGSGLLAMSHDKDGKNVFYYLKEILHAIDTRHYGNQSKKNKNNNYSSYTTRRSGNNGREVSTKSESEDDSGSDDSDDPEYGAAWEQANSAYTERETKYAEDKYKKNAIKNWVNDSLNKSPVGRFFKKSIKGVSTIISSPLKYANDLLEKANENMFKLMFGDMKLRDSNGKEIDNVFQYIVSQVKDTFDELKKSIAAQFNKYVTPLWEKLKEKVTPYAKPVWEELKNIGRAAGARIRRGVSNTFGRGMNTILNNMPSNLANKIRRGGVVSADEVEGQMSFDDLNNEGEGYEQTSFDLSARGRIAKKRGLTMISPGEIIIPASFNKKKQNKMLAAEKRDRKRIIDAIGLNAKGNVNTDEIKKYLQSIYNESKGEGKPAKIGAGGIAGGIAGLLVGNPLLGAMAGAGISILNNSETMQNIVFGELKDGERQGGLISKKIQDTFKKYLPDMGDYGIAGGLLGLLTPFGPLGGAAIGAGIGYLKNSEGFKKFIFGDTETGEDGLISKESYNKFIGYVKKASPKMLIGAGAAILGGPFGLLGNAVLGAGVGLLSETQAFHDFLYGEEGNEGSGLIGAFKVGFLQPMQDKFLEFVADFKNYAKKNIIEPMKNFWQPVTQMIQNTIRGIGESIGDFINDSFEKWIGLPLHDWLQEKLFRPMSKFVGGIVKLPYNLAKGIVALPMNMLGGIGNSIRAGQIRKGTAYNMTASERLAWRDQHSIRFGALNSWRDKTREQDEMLAALSAGDENDLLKLAQLRDTAKAGLTSYATLQRQTNKARKAVGDEISSFFNASGNNESKNRFVRVGYNKVKKLAEIAETKGYDEASAYIDKMNLTDEEKTQLKNSLRIKIQEAASANEAMKNGRKTSKELDASLSDLLGYKVKGRAARRRIMKSAEAELKVRDKLNETPEERATNNFADIYRQKAELILAALSKANTYLEALVYPNKRDTKSTSDKAAMIKKEINGTISSAGTINANTTTDDAVKNALNTTVERKNKSLLGGVFDQYTGKYVTSDPDSKENVENEKLRNQMRKDDLANTEANKQTNNVLLQIKDKLFGKSGKYEAPKEGFLSKIWDGAKKIGKFLGIGGLVLGGASLFGYASQWFKTDVWPLMKTTLFGTKDDEGNVVKEGLVGKFKTIMLGEDGYSGLLGGIRGYIFGDKEGNPGLLSRAKSTLSEFWDEKVVPFFNNTATKFKNWYISKGGLPGLLVDGVNMFLGGLKLTIDTVGPTIVGLLIKHLPGILASMAKALIGGFKQILPWSNQTIKEADNSITDGGIGDSLLGISSSNGYNAYQQGINGVKPSTDISKDLKTLVNYTGNTADTSVNVSSTSSNNKSSGGILGLLGQTKRTNDVIISEDGTRVLSDYTLKNTSDSILSGTVKSTGRALWNGIIGTKGTKLIGYTPKFLANNADNIASNILKSSGKSFANAAKNVVTPGLFNKVKAAGNVVSGTAKGAVGLAQSGLNIGDAINKKIGKIAKNADIGSIVQNGADDVIESATKSGVVKKAGKYIAKETASNGIIASIKAGIKKVFSGITESGVTKRIAEYASKFTGKATTEEFVDKTLRALADKLTDGIVQKATGSALKAVANTLAKFSPAALITFAADFTWGFTNAHTILGITKNTDYEVTIGHKCICGLINLLTNFLTWGFVPADVIVTACIDGLFPIFKIDTEELKAARQAAIEELDAYNLDPENEQKYDNLQDYNNKDKWWFKAKNSIKSGFDSLKGKVSSGLDYVKSGIKSVADSAKNGISAIPDVAKSAPDILKTASNMVLNAWNIGGNERDETIPETGDPTVDSINKAILGITNLFTFPSRMLGKGVNLVVDGISSVINASKNILTSVSNATTNMFKSASDGDLTSVLTTKPDSTGNNFTDIISNAAFGISKMFTTPFALATYGFSKIISNFKSITDKWSIANATKKSDDMKIQDALDGKISVFSADYWKNADQSKNGIFGSIATVQTYLEKILNVPVAIIKGITTSVTDILSEAKNWIGDKAESAWDWFTGLFGSGRKTVKSTAGRGRLFGKAHNYQSGALAEMPYGDSTIGESGCAPVAAANLLGGSVQDAARFAERHNMTVPGGGTDVGFFNSYLGSKGIATRNTNNKSAVLKALSNGNQVVMLGQDDYDNGAPFGTIPHYITAKGISPNGNIIAEDPDLPYSYIEYNPNDIMDSMITSVIAGNGRRKKRYGRKRRLFGRGSAEYNMLTGYTQTSSFNEHRDNKYGRHGGLDLVKSNNAPIYAFTNGRVANVDGNYPPDSGSMTNSHKNDGGGFGNYVSIIDEQGNYHVYGHLNGVNVSKNDVVSRGQQIGIQGHTGHSQGSHLHYQISLGSSLNNAKNVDPWVYLKDYPYYGGGSPVNNYGTSSTTSSTTQVSSTNSTTSSSKSSTSNLMTALGNLGKSIVKAIFGDGAYNALYGDESSNSSGNSYSDTNSTSNDYSSDNSSTGSTYDPSGSVSSDPGSNPSNMTATYNTRQIWNRLRDKGYSAAGIAGIMGNMNAESGMRANNLQDYYEKKLGMNDTVYTSKVNSKQYSRDKFINDGAGYGLVQSTWNVLKQGLYDNTVGKGLAIDSIPGQINALSSQLSSRYSRLNNYLKTTTNVSEASDKFLLQFENPANPDATKQFRRNSALGFYNLYKNYMGSSGSGTNRANIYGGNATRALNATRSTSYPAGRARYSGSGSVDYVTFLKTIVELLIGISNNTAMLNKIIDILSTKLNINIDSSDVTTATKNTTRAQAERQLNNLVSGRTNTSEYAKIMNDKDTSYLVAAMMALAGE